MPPKREQLKLATVGAVEGDGQNLMGQHPITFYNGVPIHLEKNFY
jgi:hypothetical protein